MDKVEEALMKLQPGTRGRILRFCYWIIAKKDERPLKFEDVPMIALRDASLCMNCETISPARNHHCPCCQASGSSLLSMSVVLARQNKDSNP